MWLNLANEVIDMERKYIENGNAELTRRDGDYHLNLRFIDGETIENVEARRLFPTSAPDSYITLLDEKSNEIAVIRSLADLSPKSRAAVCEAFDEYYLVPRILRITKVESRPGNYQVFAETDRGNCSFKIQNRQQDIKVLPDYRVLLRDANDNRYVISDCRTLDRKSRNYLLL